MPTAPDSAIRSTTTRPHCRLLELPSSSGKVIRISGTGLEGRLDRLFVGSRFSSIKYLDSASLEMDVVEIVRRC